MKTISRRSLLKLPLIAVALAVAGKVIFKPDFVISQRRIDLAINPPLVGYKIEYSDDPEFITSEGNRFKRAVVCQTYDPEEHKKMVLLETKKIIEEEENILMRKYFNVKKA